MPDMDRNPATGRFTARVSDENLLAAVKRHDPAATREVAETVGIARRNAHNRLEKMAEAGRVSKKKVGSSLVWSGKTNGEEP